MKNLSILILFAGIFLVSKQTFSQESKRNDSITTQQLESVLLLATRAKAKTPIAFTNIKREQLESINLGQDLPILLDQLPSVVTTSDAGAGVGYTGIRVRGTDATRVNVTINGIPYNDAESQGTFWVNLPDIVSSVEDIQLQRGVGTSTNGSAAFGASLHLQTLEPSNESYAQTTHAIGSYGTRKHNIALATGLYNNWYAEARLSHIQSDGYVDRATSDLNSFFTEFGYKSKATQIRGILFGGKEITYQSWNGVPEAVVFNNRQGIEDYIDRNFISAADADNLRNSGRTYNVYTYDNQIDNYKQNHYQLHGSHTFNSALSANLSLNYTKGEGYFEQFNENDEVGDYFPNSPDADESGDVIRRRWLDNDFYVLVYSLNYKSKKWNTHFGGSYSTYKGDHFGEIIFNTFPIDLPIRSRYYFNDATKNDFNVYAKADYKLSNRWLAFADLQYRNVTYTAKGLSADLLNINTKETYNFINPKFGLNFDIDNYQSVYGSFAVAQREPNRDDLTKNPIRPEHEQLFDFEFGYRFNQSRWKAEANFYYMDYNNQLVLTGDVDDDGGPIRQNVKSSYRTGLELQAGYVISKQLQINANATFSKNKIDRFDYVVIDTQYDPATFETLTVTPRATTLEGTDISFSPNVIASGQLSYSPLTDLNVKLLGKYVGKQFLDNTENDNRKINDYFVGNFNASYTWRPNWIKAVDVNLLVNNIFNKRYVSNGYTFSYFYRPENSTDPAITENFYYPQATTNFLLGVTLKI